MEANERGHKRALVDNLCRDVMLSEDMIDI